MRLGTELRGVYMTLRIIHDLLRELDPESTRAVLAQLFASMRRFGEEQQA